MRPLLSCIAATLLAVVWTFFSLAMEIKLGAEIVRGYPCIKRYNQLYCPTPGNNYPRERINLFIDENKALIGRMYGEFQIQPEETLASPLRDIYEAYDLGGGRTQRSRQFGSTNSNRVDSCESSVEILTPYWASNSAGKIRAIVNTQHFEQAIQQEVCQSVQTKRCSNDCSCEQKYKWHRMLSYDPEDDCKGIFMDWFLFPSCCVCRCAPIPK